MARPEQTEKATPKRRIDARARGQVTRSADLSGAVTFLATVYILHITLIMLINGFGNGLRWAIEHADYRPNLSPNAALAPYIGWTGKAFIPVGVLFCTVFVISIIVSAGQVGIHFSLKPLAPNWGRLNPVTGMKRILFSPQTFVTLFKQILKMTVLVIVIYGALHGSIQEFMALSDASPFIIIHTIEGALYGVSMRFGGVLLIIGFFDYFWERHRLSESLKMTKTEVRDEQRQLEGSREAKGAFRKRQRELARRLMLAAIPKATVVVTNPTHVAVALLWDELKMDAPIVVAKGADLVAKRVRDLAREHRVPIVENAPLARALYRDVEIGSAVPTELYAAVAKLIAFVYGLRARPTARTFVRSR